MSEKESPSCIGGISVLGLTENNRHFMITLKYNKDYSPTVTPISLVKGRGSTREQFMDHYSILESIKNMHRPRRILFVAQPDHDSNTDFVIQKVLPLLEKGDVFVDGGNSDWKKSQARETCCDELGVTFVACVSDNNADAKYMHSEAYRHVKDVYRAFGKYICGEKPSRLSYWWKIKRPICAFKTNTSQSFRFAAFQKLEKTVAIYYFS